MKLLSGTPNLCLPWLVLALVFLPQAVVPRNRISDILTGDLCLVRVAEENTNGLLARYEGKMQSKASSVYGGYPSGKVIDGNLATSWFSATKDTAASGKRPFVEVVFPEDVTIRRVTILGNREPSWLEGFGVLSSQLEIRDANGRVLWSDRAEATGARNDFDYRPARPIGQARRVRFLSTRDQGDCNSYEAIAIGEVRID